MTIQVRRYLTATNGDILAGTDLESVPSNGVMLIFAASTQIDGTVTVTAPRSRSPANQMPLIQRATQEIKVNEDVPVATLQVRQGDSITLAYTEVTAATAQFLVLFRPRG